MTKRTRKKPTQGQLIARYAELRKALTEQNKIAEGIKAERDQVMLQLIETMKENDTVRASTNEYTATITTNIVPTVKDWDAFYNFIYNEKAIYLLQRRPLAAAYREMIEMRDGAPIPGVESFEQEGISLKTVS